MEFDNFCDDTGDSDEFDEFLFQSIQRYNTLLMFNLENVPYQLLQIDDKSLCVVSKRSTQENSEILKLRLPNKLTLPPEEEGRCKGNDFKILSGLYMENLIYKIDKFPTADKIIASEIGSTGLKIYTLNEDLLGIANKGTKLDVTQWGNTDFMVLPQNNEVICFKCISEPLIQVDMRVEKKIKEIRHPFQETNVLPQHFNCEHFNFYSENNIKIEKFDENSIIILNSLKGDLLVYDLRTDNSFTKVSVEKEKADDEKWILSGCDSKKYLNYFGILSNRKNFNIYDKRNNSILFKNEETDSPSTEFEFLKLKFSGCSDKFSISGFDSLVEIFKMNGSNYHHAFTHNGHNPSNSTLNKVTDHIWLQTKYKEFVLSVCDNKTLNCWDYNVKNVEKEI